MDIPENKNEILERFRQGPRVLEKALEGISETELDYKPSKGGWTIREIIHHITDGDDLWKAGIKMAMGNDSAEYTLKWYLEFPQTEWAKRWNYEHRSIDVSLSLQKANRAHLLQLLEYAPDEWSRTFPFREPVGEITEVNIGFVIKMQADHLEHHVKRISEIRREIAG